MTKSKFTPSPHKPRERFVVRDVSYSSVARKIVRRLSLLLAIFSLLSPTAYAQQSASASATPPQSVTRIVFSVTDKEGRPIKQLTASDIRVMDNGQPQVVLNVERRMDTPLSVAIMVDTSASQARLQSTARRTAQTFVTTVMRDGTDQVAIVSFRGTLQAEQEFTSEKPGVLEAIERLLFATAAEIGARGLIIGSSPPDRDFMMTGATAIWETVINASDGFSSPATAGTRRAILLLTDGEDTFSGRTLKEAAQSAVNSEVTIYAIGMSDKRYHKINTGNLKNLTGRTGGRAFFPKDFDELPSIFSQIEEDLRSGYVATLSRTQPKQRNNANVTIQISNPALKNARLIYHREP